ESASTSHFLSGYSKIKFYDLILLGIHCNGYGQIFKENLSQNQRFCVETSLFRLTITIIARRQPLTVSPYGEFKFIVFKGGRIVEKYQR
ncbi:MAG: hypothetical protein IJD71_00495, partial [Clostridia bacterium]|nr:hypothetical protein [Clostridia bacterium]